MADVTRHWNMGVLEITDLKTGWVARVREVDKFGPVVTILPAASVDNGDGTWVVSMEEMQELERLLSQVRQALCDAKEVVDG